MDICEELGKNIYQNVSLILSIKGKLLKYLKMTAVSKKGII